MRDLFIKLGCFFFIFLSPWGKIALGSSPFFSQGNLPYTLNLLCLDDAPDRDKSVLLAIKIEAPSTWKLSSERKKDSQMGITLSFDWALPKGGTITKIGGSSPLEILENGVTNNVYRGNHVHLFKLHGSFLKEQEPFVISVRIKGLFCHDMCIPVDEVRKISLVFPYERSFEEQKLKEEWEHTPQNFQNEEEKDINEDKVFFPMLLFMGFLGGLLLNAMPCVFPILSLKILHLLQYTTPQKQSLHTWGYGIGVIGSFVSLGMGVTVLQWFGHHVGWGFQMQSPVFILLLMGIFFVLGLHLSGVFNLPGFSFFLKEEGSKASITSSFVQSMGTGVVSTLAATPCTAPFMAPALGYALTASSFDVFSLMCALGVGFMAPFCVLAKFPRLLSFLPKPGAWMMTFKESLAFLLYGSVVWLCWVLSKQIGEEAILYGGGILIIVFFCIWFYRVMQPFKKKRSQLLTFFTLLFVASIPFIFVTQHQPDPEKSSFELYTNARFKTLKASQKPIFVYATAAWCVNCHANERLLNKESIQNAFKNHNITVLKADYTNHNKDVAAFLKDHGHQGVPFYVFYNAQGQSYVFPQILNEKHLLNVLRNDKKP